MDGFSSIVIMSVIILFAGFTQGLTSFGFALISVPFLSLFLPISEVVPMVVALSLGTNLLILAQTFRKIELQSIWLLIVASVVGAPVGAWALLYVDASAIKLVVGVLIVMVSVLMLFGRSFPLRSPKLAFLPVGFLSGLLNGSISMSGPPVALFLSNQNTEKDVFRANITFYAVILNCFTLATFGATGLVTKEVLFDTLWMVPTMLIGVFLGSLFLEKIDQEQFKRIALFLILASGVWTLVALLPR